MNDMLAKMQDKLKDLIFQIRVQYATLMKKPLPKDPKAISTESGTTYEINLVPAVKGQMIKAQKIRNRVLFGCIVVTGAALGVVLILFSIKSGQDIAMSSQDKRLANLSEKINSYSELDGLITIQNQLNRQGAIIDNRQVISRAFGALGVVLPQGGDSVQLSELRVDLDTGTIMMEGQADARVDPLIDYRVLEAFKKSVGLTKYDYGRYVDMEDRELPTQCIKESDADGNAFREGDSYYAWWDLTIPGCEGIVIGATEGDSTSLYHYSKNAEVETAIVQVEEAQEVEPAEDDSEEATDAETNASALGGFVSFEQSLKDLQLSNEDKEVVMVSVEKELPVRVKIWRTPRFEQWYKDGLISLSGSISGIEHFQSACYQYSGVEDNDDVHWASENNCYLAPDGLTVTSSSNGRDGSDNLVLKFTATTVYDDAFFLFANKHMIAIGPMGQNVTDSFVQISNMFAKEAQACADDDLECLGDTENSGNDKSSSNGNSTGSNVDDEEDE